MKTQRASWALPLALLALMSFAWLAVRFGVSPAPAAPSATSATTPAPDAAAEAPADSPVVLPPAVDPFVGQMALPSACLDAHDEDETMERPTVWSAVSEMEAELRDRARRLFAHGEGSEALREGLAEVMRRDGDAEAGLARLAGAPDRVVDHFDHAAAAATVLSALAIQRSEPDEAERRTRLAIDIAPSETLTHALRATHLERTQRPGEALEALDRAARLAPHHPAIALGRALRLSTTDRVSDALAAFDTYLAELPADAGVRTLRERAALRVELEAGMARVETRRVIVRYAPASLPQRRAVEILHEVEAVLNEAARWIGETPRERLFVFVYPSLEALHRATCTPGWTGGVYDGALRVSADRMSMPDEASRVLRHEGFHAQLHADLDRRPPLWLEEGLARYFSGERLAPQSPAITRIVERGSTIPFASLEGAFTGIDDTADAGFAYDQSLAMTEMLFARLGADTPRRALAALDHEDGARDVFARLLPAEPDAAALRSWLASR